MASNLIYLITLSVYRSHAVTVENARSRSSKAGQTPYLAPGFFFPLLLFSLFPCSSWFHSTRLLLHSLFNSAADCRSQLPPMV